MVNKASFIELQKLRLERKIGITQARIAEWYNHWQGQVYIAFSGGKDSTVLLDLVRKLYPDVKAVFSNTGLEFPEIVEFVKTFDNVDIIRPKMPFNKVIKKYGYPVISKEQSAYIYEYRNSKSQKLKDLRLNGNSKGNFKISNKWKYLINAPFKISDKCCDVLKKEPAETYEKETGKKPFVATLAEESKLRMSNYLKYGCNAFENKRPISKPLSIWTEQDILEYIDIFKLPIAKVYGELLKDDNGKYYLTGENRTGCMFCMYGCHLEKKPNKFQRLAKTHPKIYDYCINKLNIGEVLEFININYQMIYTVEDYLGY